MYNNLTIESMAIILNMFSTDELSMSDLTEEQQENLDLNIIRCNMGLSIQEDKSIYVH